jgi:hypothetical protein
MGLEVGQPVAACGSLLGRSPTPSRWCNKGSCSLQYRQIAGCRMVDWKGMHKCSLQDEGIGRYWWIETVS